MIRLTLNIPTTKKELKNFIKQMFGWMTHPVRMKKNKSLFNELYFEICDELNSNYWRNDISKEMRDRLTSPYGDIAQIIFDKKNKLL